MKIPVLLSLFFIYNICFSQENSDPLLVTDNPIQQGPSVLLYEIELENIKIPIALNYNNSGIKADEIPGPMGVSWRINDIGRVTKYINGLPDEYQSQIGTVVNGWFFSADNNPYAFIGTWYSGQPLPQNYDWSLDSSPDFFSAQLANGINTTYIYRKNFDTNNNLLSPTPIFLDINTPLIINTNFNNFHYDVDNFTDIVFDFNDEDGFKYSFIGGPANTTITRSGSGHKKKDFYLKKIESSQNNDVVTIDYIRNDSKFYRYWIGGRVISNDYVRQYHNDYGWEENDKLEYSIITTPKEIIKFHYWDQFIGEYSAHSYQSVKHLSEIEVFDKQGNYITGYHFGYNAYQDGRFYLTDVYKYDNIKSTSILIKHFDYYDGQPNDVESHDIDMFGYSVKRGANNATPMVHSRRFCSSNTLHPAGDRNPHFDGILEGMLKKVTNNLGATTEYFYRLKGGEEDRYYGGGLVVSKIIETPEDGKSKTTFYTYSDLRGLLHGDKAYKFQFEMHYSYSSGVSATNYPVEFQDTEAPHAMFPDFQTQVYGNYFAKVVTKTYYGKWDYYPDDLGEINLVTIYDYIPSYQGIFRKPLLQRKKVVKEYLHNGIAEGEAPIYEENYSYDLFFSDKIDCTNKSYRSYQSACDNDESDIHKEWSVKKRPLYVIRQPLRRKTVKQYDYIEEQTVITEYKTDYTYYGEGTSSFTELRPKEITNYKNGLPISKKKFKYLFEIYPGSGLTDLSSFSTKDKTLLVEESDWKYSVSNKWILNEAEHYQFYNDGKIKRYFKTHKNLSNNTFYDEQNYFPVYSAGNLTGISIENQLDFSYDVDGRLRHVSDTENGKYRIYNREHDRNEYDVNTILEGNLHLYNNDVLYRNSFESETNNVATTSQAYTGSKVYTGASLIVGSYPAGYLVSFWYYKNNKWEFTSSVHPGGTVTVSMPSEAVYLDEVWVRPASTILTGCTYLPLVGKSSVIDDRGQVIKTIYDAFGRDVKQADKDNNVLQQKEYNLIQD
jgi:hypothetical protein